MKRLTLDTNLIIEYWKNQKNRNVVEELILLSEKGELDIVVTRRIEDDIPLSPMSDKISELPDLGIEKIGSVTRLGSWVLGQDMLGDDAFANFEIELEKKAKLGGFKVADWRDFDHVHARFLADRDVFLTWDKGILKLAGLFQESFQVTIMKPEDFLEIHNKN